MRYALIFWKRWLKLNSAYERISRLIKKFPRTTRFVPPNQYQQRLNKWHSRTRGILTDSFQFLSNWSNTVKQHSKKNGESILTEWLASAKAWSWYVIIFCTKRLLSSDILHWTYLFLGCQTCQYEYSHFYMSQQKLCMTIRVRATAPRGLVWALLAERTPHSPWSTHFLNQNHFVRVGGIECLNVNNLQCQRH